MISIKRLECPDVLKNSPIDGDHYNHQDVVKRLWKMQHKKCCYCECEIPRRGPGKQVEHFRPKETLTYKKLRNHWANLLLACPHCNNQKSDEFPTFSNGKPKLIDPSQNRANPERHIEFVAELNGDDFEPIGLPQYRTPRGLKTIEVIGLWMVDKVRARRKHFETRIRPIYVRMQEAKKDNNKKDLKKATSDLEKLMLANSEFAGFVRSFARNMELDKRYDVKIPTGTQA